MEPVFEFAIELPPRDSRNLLRALHGQLRAAILDGRLQPGLRLPATRALAAAYGVSRHTAVATYDLLLSEGYLLTHRGAGTYVADVLPHTPDRRVPVSNPASDRRLNAFWRQRSAVSESSSRVSLRTSLRFDFCVGLPDQERFPFEIWRRLSARALRALSRAPAAYAEPQGREALRNAIAKHVSFARRRVSARRHHRHRGRAAGLRSARTRSRHAKAGLSSRVPVPALAEVIDSRSAFRGGPGWTRRA